MKTRLLLITLPFAVFLSACAEFPMIATRNDISRVEQSVLKIEKNMENVQRNQAELGMRLEELMENLMVVTENIDVLSRKLGKPAGKAVVSRPTAPAAKKSPAKEIYDLACKDYVKGDYSLAIMGFDELLKRHQDDVLAAKAQYWKGECYFSQSKWDEAIKEFTKVISNFHGSDEVKKAEFKKALALIKLRQNEKAILLLDEIIKKYPHSNEAKQASVKKEEIKNQQ